MNRVDPELSSGWDMSAYFSAHRGPDYVRFREQLAAARADLARRADLLPVPDAESHGDWRPFLLALEALGAKERHLLLYLGCIGAADANDEAIRADTALLAAELAETEKIWATVRARLRDASDAAFEALIRDPELRQVGYAISREREEAQTAMAPELEALAADLGVTGISAWGRLYDTLCGMLSFELEVPGAPARELPVSMLRSLLGDPDPAVRRAALEGGNRAWERVSEPVAACLNAIAGTRLMLYRRRGVGHFLEPALFDAAIERRTLDTLLAAVRARQELPRRFLLLKARALGRTRLGFQDLEAPLIAGPEARLTWAEGTARVLEAFGSYPALEAFARRAIEGRWIDWQPRPGRRPGGFCSSSPLIDQSRIFLTFGGAAGDVSTLAHELGHGFHAALLAGSRPWSRRFPMTLAETASIFAEQLLGEDRLARPDAGRSVQLGVLDERLTDAVAFLLNIPMRFDFEYALYSERQAGELSVSRLKALMLEAQCAHFGDSIDPGELDPMFWASKLHFYITGTSFYNFPYTFGYLLARGLFARFLAEGAPFLARYEAFLRRSGSGNAEDVARSTLGIELGEPEFWHASIDLIARDLERFEQALGAAVQG